MGKMATKSISEIALAVAIDAKASGIGVSDLGCFYPDDEDLTDPEWEAVCDEATALYPTVEVPASVWRSWAKVNSDLRAEERSERILCGGA
jgi:hypothetical protein